MKQIRCPNKHGWFDAKEGCPECGYQPVFNKGLRAAQLNSHLFAQAERAKRNP